jgi:hypothetical protein
MNRELLEQPFEKTLIKQRKGYNGNILDYVEGPTVIQRLNDAFDGQWTFEVVRHQILDNEIVVLGKFTADGIIKMQYGASQITKSKDDNTPICIGDDMKAAATDALKKTATLLGVGLRLYRNDNPLVTNLPKPENKAAEEPEKPANGNGRLTNKQLSCIFAIAKSKGMQNKDIKALTIEQFNKQPEFLTKSEASSFIKELSQK